MKLEVRRRKLDALWGRRTQLLAALAVVNAKIAELDTSQLLIRGNVVVLPERRPGRRPYRRTT